MFYALFLNYTHSDMEKENDKKRTSGDEIVFYFIKFFIILRFTPCDSRCLFTLKLLKSECMLGFYDNFSSFSLSRDIK